MKLIHASKTDIPVIEQILSDGRNTQRKQGFRQWEDGYPSRDTIINDILNNQGYLLTDGENFIAYVAISFRDEEYERLNYIWTANGLYGVIHRMAISQSYSGKGISSVLFDITENIITHSGVSIIRVDTGTENKVMQHILATRGYNCVGLHNFIWGERLAYEKIILSC